ncbi:MAG: hypothetical protein U0641_04980 [Anaerolineae bacterium]
MSSLPSQATRVRRTERRRDNVRRRLVALMALLALCIVVLARRGERGGPRWYWRENSEPGAGGLAAL